MAGPHTIGYKGTGESTVGHGIGMGLDYLPRSKRRRMILGSVLFTLGVLAVAGGLALLYAPFLVIGALLIVTGLIELRKGKEV